MRSVVMSAMLLSMVGLLSCTGGASEPEAVEQVSDFVIPPSLLEQTWISYSLKEGVLPPYFKNAGWVALVGKRDLKGAVQKLGPLGGLGAARAHAEAANMYRQAALVAAESLVQTYAETPASTDPVAVAHLLTVSYSVLGKLDKAREQSKKMTGLSGTVVQWHAPWAKWLSGGAVWPPDLSALPFEIPELKAGLWPVDVNGVDYQLAEQVDGVDASSISVDDPSTLVVLAMWHDAMAKKSAGPRVDLVSLFGARYRLPVEGAFRSSATLPFEMMIGSDYLTSADAVYLADRYAGEAATGFTQSSVLAYVVEKSQVDGKMDREKALDFAAELRKQLLDFQAATNGGTLEGTHRMFAKLAEVGLLRNLALIAELDGDRETSGVLRINAMEKSAEAFTACPVASLSLSAWDVSNRYTLRPTDKLHGLIRRYPSLETTRFSLEVLAIRDSRRAPGGIPGN